MSLPEEFKHNDRVEDVIVLVGHRCDFTVGFGSKVKGLHPLLEYRLGLASLVGLIVGNTEQAYLLYLVRGLIMLSIQICEK